ncbi:MAG: hypothetical protein E6J91_19450 [Deltaproteobacteria bacterium]|nr:MAG: hypothetical protein E6J91_19450 [Deltaproteobacteria bacterium]
MKSLPLLALALALVAHAAAADPLRLRADALATTASPAGLLVLDASGAAQPGLSAEAVVWLAGGAALPGTPGDSSHGDVLVIAIDAHTPGGMAAARLGRFVVALGALRPEHLDGGSARLQLPQRFVVEAAAGVPVMPGLTMDRALGWVAASRVSRRFGDWGSAGIAYEQRRDDGQLVTEELAADAGMALGRRDDLGARIAYDVANPGLAEVALTASHRSEHVRAELYASHRAASHLLPATTLFSVIGDVPAQRAGAVITWAAAPRLDVIADAGARRVDADISPELVGRARLKLDDRGASAISAELRRSGVAGEAWTGARAAARIALSHRLVASTELELVRPDEPRGRGTLWPWALGALSWDRGDWQSAIAVEASASPEYRSRVDVLFQLSRRWGTP